MFIEVTCELFQIIKLEIKMDHSFLKEFCAKITGITAYNNN